MFTTVSHFFNALVFLDLTLAILCCILLIKVSTKYALKFVTIPVILLVTYVLIIQGEDILGRPYDVKPVGKFEFIDYRVVVSDGLKKIELWVVQEKKSRLHVVGYSENYEKEMAKAKSRRNKGSRERGEFSNKPGNSNSELSLSTIPPEELLPPKDGEVTPEEEIKLEPKLEVVPEKQEEQPLERGQLRT
jgi:hypothetical protein